jgi:superfamily II DNA or RNA helicase
MIITIGVTRSQLSEYIDGLDEALSCFYEGYFFSPRYKQGAWDGKIHFLAIPYLTFPTGLLFMVEEFFKGKNIEYKIVDQRIMPYVNDIPVDRINILRGIILRDYQLEAIDRALKTQTGVLELPTGSGKTEIAAALIKLVGVKTLFLVHTQDLLRQTIKRFKERIGLEIGCIGDGEFDIEDKNVIVATVQSIHRWLDTEPDKSRKFLDSFQMLFQDECHHSSARIWERIGMLCKNAFA